MSSTKNRPQSPPIATKWSSLGLVTAVIGVVVAFYGLSKSLDLKNALTKGIDCNVNNWINCDTAFSSSFASLLGIPVSAWGLFFYAFAVVAFFVIRSSKNNSQPWGTLLLYLSAFSIAFSLLKAYQLVQLKVLCPVCLGMYVLNALIFVFAWLSGYRFNLPDLKKMAMPLGVFALIFGFGYLLTTNQLKKIQADADTGGATSIDSVLQKIQAIAAFDKADIVEIPITADTPVSGGKNAKAVLHVFSDFQCPGCKRAADLISQFKKEFGEDLRVYDYAFPLDMSINRILKNPMHPFAGDAAKLGVCAQKIGKYWEYHDQVFARQADITADMIREVAKNVGIQDPDACLADAANAEKVKADIEQGIALNLTGTPGIFLNGRPLSVTGNYDVIKALIQREISRN